VELPCILLPDVRGDHVAEVVDRVLNDVDASFGNLEKRVRRSAEYDIAIDPRNDAFRERRQERAGGQELQQPLIGHPPDRPGRREHGREIAEVRLDLRDFGRGRQAVPDRLRVKSANAPQKPRGPGGEFQVATGYHTPRHGFTPDPVAK